MSDNVINIGAGPIQAERRELFARAVSEAFDIYVRAYGCEPEVIAFVLNGITQPSQIGWHATGASEAGVTSALSLAAVHMLAEAQDTHQGLSQ